MIADGRTIIIIDGKVIKADTWLRFHPGGDKAIMHMVGRDATDEVNAYEPNNYKGGTIFADCVQLIVCIHWRPASICQDFR